MKRYLLVLLFPAWLWAAIGNVAAVTGSAVVKRGGQTIPIRYGTAIEEKDTIVTRKRSRVQIVLNDQTIVTVGERSRYSFQAYRFHTKADSKLTMKLGHGFFRVISGKIGKLAPKRFKVESKSATIGIRGTHFFGRVRKHIEEYGCIGGRIYVATPSRSYALTPGKKVVLRNRAWSVKPIAKRRMKRMRRLPKQPLPRAHDDQQNLIIQHAVTTACPPSRTRPKRPAPPGISPKTPPPSGTTPQSPPPAVQPPSQPGEQSGQGGGGTLITR